MFQSATLEVILEFLPDVIRQHPAFNGKLRLKLRERAIVLELTEKEPW